MASSKTILSQNNAGNISSHKPVQEGWIKIKKFEKFEPLWWFVEVGSLQLSRNISGPILKTKCARYSELACYIGKWYYSCDINIGKYHSAYCV